MAPMKVGDYLFKRLHELGIRSVFGVPGDYELTLLDLVEPNGLEWKGNANELVASYAADGYARVNGAGAFITTFGPGELSAYCGMAGQYCEMVPVIHIVGYPSTTAAAAGEILHHSLGDGRFDMYEQMSKHITAATEVLRVTSDAAEQIDRVLTVMMQKSRPVYLGVPVDIALAEIDGQGLQQPLETALALDDIANLQRAVGDIRARLESAAYPVVIADGNTTRNAVLPEANELVRVLSFPTFVTFMGKGGIDETLPCYAGLYAGVGTHPGVKAAIDRADTVLWLGRVPSDFNTAEFTMDIADSKIIEVQRYSTSLGNHKYDVKMKYLLQALIEDFRKTPPSVAPRAVDWQPYPLENPSPKGTALTQDFLWGSISRCFKAGDMVIGETGTSAFGVGDARLPANSLMFNQTVFGSIGYATGSALGAFMAARESGKFKRGILITGEGSLQMTVQAIGDMIRYRLKPIIFILNNNGYTVERLIHGKTALYNDLAVWDYGKLASAFGPGVTTKYHGPIKTDMDFEGLLSSNALEADCLQIVELVLGPLDAPLAVRKVGKAIEEFNSKKSSLGE